MQFDQVIEAIQPFGRYQKRNYLLTCLLGVPASLHTMVTVFILATPEHRCAIPGLENDTWNSQGPDHDELLGQVIPFDSETNTWSQCSLFKYRSLLTPDDPRNDTDQCSKWVYNKADFDLTVISELNLICGNRKLVTLSNSILMGGLFCGSLILGTLSDVIGRKKTMMIGILGQFAVALATAFVSNYIVFIVLRFLTTFFGIGFYLAAFVAAMELVGPAKRVLAGVVIVFSWCLGLFIILLLAYLLPNWHHLQIAVSCFNILFFFYFWLIPESPRWLVSRGRIQEASAIVRHAARVNKTEVSEKVLSLQDLQSDAPQEKFWHMFRSPRLLVLCVIIFFNWCVVSMAYYGLGLNVGNLPGGLFLNFLYANIAETLACVFCLLLLDRTGRRFLHCFTMLLGGAACASIIFPVLYGSESLSWLTISLSMVGKFSVSAAFTVIYIFSAELFPTVVRNSGIGASSFSARIGGIVSPYISDISSFVKSDFGTALPYLIFGGLSIVAGLASLWLPETLHQTLPETIDDARNFGRKNKNSQELEVNCKVPAEREMTFVPSSSEASSALAHLSTCHPVPSAVFSL